MRATERWRILQNIIAQKGTDVDLYAELARAEAMINAIDQTNNVMPQPTMDMGVQSTAPTSENFVGKYDNL